jgi:hypothetical protein
LSDNDSIDLNSLLSSFCSLLKDWPDMVKEKCKGYILNCQGSLQKFLIYRSLQWCNGVLPAPSSLPLLVIISTTCSCMPVALAWFIMSWYEGNFNPLDYLTLCKAQ